MKEEVKRELERLKRKTEDPIHVVCNYIILVAECCRSKEQVPEEANELFDKAIESLKKAWNFTKATKDLLWNFVKMMKDLLL
jgi:hypothetical protein